MYVIGSKIEKEIPVKFEAAYLRSLDFKPATEQEVGAVYAKCVRDGAPARPEYLRLQNYLFRYIAPRKGKVMFSTDLFPGAGAIDWEEIGWQPPRLPARRYLAHGNDAGWG